MIKTGIVALSLAGLVSLANAATPGFYLGGGLGANKFSDSSSYDSKTYLAGQLFAGYNVNKYFGIEAALAHYARESFHGGSANANGDFPKT